MPVAWSQIEPLLLRVEKPARYVGGEFNQVIKPEAAARCCLAFPDLYEIGMSYHGYRLLYERVNSTEGWAAERAFTPWTDMEAVMREAGVPLWSLETQRGLLEFDWVGFTLQHEVNYTNILTMIDLAGMPLESAVRDASDVAYPLLIGGGEGAFSPEPLAPFLDAFLIGDGEEAVLDLMRLTQHARREGWTRLKLMHELALMPGVYVPRFYDFTYHEDGRIATVAVKLPAELEGAALPALPIHKRYFDVGRDLGAVRPVVPLMRTVHDRFAIEIRRGCVNGCRFCQAGMITRPVNERPLEQIVEIARQGILNTGYDEISLLSLSSADYTVIGPLVAKMTEEFGAGGVSVSLPSLRINAFDVSLVDEIAKVRKSGFTFAPEAGTTRLRNVINKPVDQDRFFQIIEDVFQRGWRTVKFYFMIGLPTETDEDLDGIVEICERAAELGRRYHGRRAVINVTLSPFVPKSNTPFQWEPQPPREELERRFEYVKQAIRRRVGPRAVDIKTADTGSAFIEAVLARGDRKVGLAMRRAWELGARFDGWDERFRLGFWLRAFEDVGLDAAFYANRTREESEVLPFDHLESDVGRRFLWADQRRAWRERVMEKCDTGKCAGCDVCDETIDHTLAQDMQPGGKLAELARTDYPAAVPAESAMPIAELLPHPEGFLGNRAMEQVMATRNKHNADGGGEVEGERETRGRGRDARECGDDAGLRGGAAHPQPTPVQRVRLTYLRGGGLNYLSHLDFSKVVHLILRRARIPVAYSSGFNPQMRVMFAPPLSLGMGGESELVDVLLTRRMDLAAMLQAMGAIELEGLHFVAAEEVPVAAPSMEADLIATRYRVSLGLRGDELAALRATTEALAAAEHWPAQVRKKDSFKTLDLKTSLHEVRWLEPAAWTDPAWAELELEISMAPGTFVKPHEALAALVGRPLELGRDLRAARVEFRFGQPAAAAC